MTPYERELQAAFGELHAALERYTARRITQDARTIDPDPDRCWRCDTAAATRDVGLCAPCHADLRGERA